MYEIEGEDPQLRVKGVYSYFAPDGQEFQVEYTADKDGFQPQGFHLPKTAEQLDAADVWVGLPGAAIKSLLG